MTEHMLENFIVAEWQLALNQIGEGYDLFDDGSVALTLLNKQGEAVFHYLGLLVMVTRVVIDVDSNVHTFMVSMVTSDGYVREQAFGASIFNKYRLSELQKFGGAVHLQEADLIIDLLERSARCAKIEYTTKALGWRTMEGVDNPIYIGKKSYLSEDQLSVNGDMLRYDMTPTGSWDAVHSLLLELSDNVQVMAVVAIAFSAFLFPIAIDAGLIGIFGLLVSICGNSSSGKSVTASLATSLFGRVDGGLGSLRGSWFGSAASRTLRLADLSGIPLLFDELSAAIDTASIKQFIFALSDGHDKLRGTNTGGLQQAASWRGLIVLSTTETSIFHHLSGLDGNHVRVLELQGEMTRSHDEAVKITSVIKNNFGVGIPKIMEYIDQVGYSKFTDSFTHLFQEQKRLIDPKLSSSKLGQRIAANLAMFSAGVDLMKLAFDLPGISVSDITDYLVEQVQRQLNTFDDGAVAQDQIIQWIAQSHASVGLLSGKLSSGRIPDKPIGYLVTDELLEANDDSFNVAILSDVMKQQLKKNGTKNIAAVLTKFEQSDFLIRLEKDRLMVRRNFDGKRNRFYVLRIPRSLLSVMPTLKDVLAPEDENEILAWSNDESKSTVSDVYDQKAV